MGSGAGAGAGVLALFILLFGAVLTVVWIVLPFVIFGIKNRIDVLIGGQRRGNELMEELLHELRSQHRKD